jgi:hypothetical protein
MLEASFESLLGRARNPDQIEICIAYDDDDSESHEYFTGPAWPKFRDRWKSQDQIYRLPRWGYRELHLYVNYLGERARGKWLFFWGDDAVMETQNWDDHVRDNQDWVGLLHITASNAPMNCSILPLFHRRWIEIFGCVTPVNPADSWISDICWKARARRVIPVSIFHDRYEDSGRNQDQTWHDKKNAVGWHRDYHLPEFAAMRDQWANQLRQYLSSQR